MFVFLRLDAECFCLVTSIASNKNGKVRKFGKSKTKNHSGLGIARQGNNPASVLHNNSMKREKRSFKNAVGQWGQGILNL
jgi:hypothetical protein